MNLSVRLVVLLAAFLGLVLFFSLLNPGVTYPLEGLASALGLVGLMLASGLLARSAKEKVPVQSHGAAWLSPGVFLLAFTAWVWLRTALSAVPSEGGELLGNFLLGLAAFWTAAQLTRQLPAFPRWVAWLFCGLGVFFACHAILEYHYLYAANLAEWKKKPGFNPADILSEGVAFALQARRVSSYFGNPNVLAGFLATCMPFLAALAWGAGEPRRHIKRAGLAVAAVLICYAASRTSSAGGMMVLATGIGLCAVAVLVAKKRAVQVVAAGLMLGALLFLPGAAEVAQKTDSAPPPRAARTLQQRAFYLQSAWTMFKQAPIVGHGLGGYARLYPKARVLGASETCYAHNFVAQLAVETGLVGLTLFFAFVLTLLYAGWHGARCAETLAGMAALLLFLLDSLGDYSFFVRELYVVVCLIAGVVFGVSSVKDCPSHRYTCWLSVALCVAGLAVSIAPTQMILQDKRTLQDLWGELRSANPEEARQIALDSWEIAENAVRKNPANPSVWQLHSYAASYMGHPEIALTDLKKAATLNPYSAQLRADLARCEWERGNRNEALDWVSQAIALYPLRSGHYVLRATFLQKMGRSVEALADAQKANQVAFTPLEQAECAKLLETLSRAKQN